MESGTGGRSGGGLHVQASVTAALGRANFFCTIRFGFVGRIFQKPRMGFSRFDFHCTAQKAFQKQGWFFGAKSTKTGYIPCQFTLPLS